MEKTDTLPEFADKAGLVAIIRERKFAITPRGLDLLRRRHGLGFITLNGRSQGRVAEVLRACDAEMAKAKPAAMRGPVGRDARP